MDATSVTGRDDFDLSQATTFKTESPHPPNQYEENNQTVI